MLRATKVPRGVVLLYASFFIMSYKEVITFDNLYKGLKKSCRNVRWKDSTVGYEGNALKNTYRLRQSLLNGTYKLDRYQHFTVYEPKKREIVATRLKDRQFQRSLCDNGLYEQITKSFITDNCACLRGRGVDYTLNRLTAHLRRYRIENGADGWVLKCDIYHYFPSIRHDIAKAAICKRVTDKEIAARACEIVDSFGEIGLGLGSQVSQLVALAVLDDLDHYIKERLRIKHYIRYMDDFILIHPDKAYLQYCRHEIEKKLHAIGLQLNQKTVLYPLRQGVKLLQWRFIIADSGAIIRKMSKKKQGKQRRKLKKLLAKEQSGDYAPGTARESLISYLANAARGNTYHERLKMITFYKNLEVKAMNNTIFKRLAKAEAMANAQKAELMETLQAAYERACAEENAEDAAELARKIRNKLLDNTDKEMSLDRLGLDTSSATKFIASLTTIFSGAWAQYRQELRDITKQEGFPFDIIFPTPPDETEEE